METIDRIQIKSKQPPAWLRLRIWLSGVVFRGKNRGGQGGNIIRLPFKRVAKLNTHRNELDAMEFVRKHTTIPIPKILEAYAHGDVVHIVMEEVVGNRTGTKTMTSEQGKVFAKELADYLGQLRGLQPPEKGFIGSVSLGSSLDHRLSGTRFGPFHSVADFHTYLRRGRPVEHWKFEPAVVKDHEQLEKYCVRFAHADLAPSNILSVDGHITAILDWEFAGWYPEYWDYTKMYWAERPVFKKFFEAIEGEPGIVKYPEALDSERSIWKHMNPFSYDSPPWSPNNDEKTDKARYVDDDNTW